MPRKFELLADTQARIRMLKQHTSNRAYRNKRSDVSVASVQSNSNVESTKSQFNENLAMSQ